MTKDKKYVENEEVVNQEAESVQETTESPEREETVEGAESELARCRLELEEAKDRVLRLHADFDNFRKRLNREKEEWTVYSAQGLVEKLLPVLDNFELALATTNSANQETAGILSGVTMIYRQLNEVLTREGLKPIQALGEIFDPQIHEAIMQVPGQKGQADNQVVEELRKGYRFKEKILRPAMVKVAKNTEVSEEE